MISNLRKNCGFWGTPKITLVKPRNGKYGLRKFKKSKIHLRGSLFFVISFRESYCKSPEIGERNDGDGAVKGDSGCS